MISLSDRLRYLHIELFIRELYLPIIQRFQESSIMFRTALVLTLSAWACSAQMTPAEKVLDFSQLAATYAMNYGPIQWKREYLHFDLLNIGDWLAKAQNTKDDLDFYELCVSYVASLDDAHDVFQLPVDPVAEFQAYLGFTVDLYDGKTIIESIGRKQLNEVDFPFQVGDELVSIDGVAAQDLLQSLTKYAIAANPRSTSRVAADYITFRDQAIMPHAHVIPSSSTVVINRRDGRLQTFSIPWLTQGTPIQVVGPVIPPFSSSAARDQAPPDYRAPLKRLRNMRVPARRFIQGFGQTKPVFNLPSNFVLRSGAKRFDLFYSGTYEAQGKKIGFLRIPSFEFFIPDELQAEIDFMLQNTDGLIVDIMRNPGGDGCVAEDLLSRIIPYQFRTIGLEIRATRSWVAAFQDAVQEAKDAGESDDVVSQLQGLLDQVTAAFLTPSGRTPPLPVCDVSLDVPSATDANGNGVAYYKPVMLLVDELTASAGDLFAAVFQDNHRGPVFGMRTMGAGGNVSGFPVTTYSEGLATITESLMHRTHDILTSDYPAAPYVENIGVRPDIVQDYMTVDNLLNQGATFVQAFTDAMVQLIQNTAASSQLPAVGLRPFASARQPQNRGRPGAAVPGLPAVFQPR